ncbi:hypothetical protein ON010_g6561 [Phytophthora cinnamomi]|nr:hypothetical protein ON010_g6561 [Phytophthora cinnamomi]
MSGELAVVRYLAEQGGADVNARTANGFTALVVAARFGCTEVVRYLAEQCDADGSATDEDGSSALLLAAANGHMEVARYLVEHCGLDVDVKNTSGYTALMGAARENHLEMVSYLVGQCGAAVEARNNGGDAALAVAAAHGNVQVVRHLVSQCGADVDARNEAGATALMWAAATGRTEVVRKNDRIEIVRYLVEQRAADISVKSNDGFTALMLAARDGKLELVRYLAEVSGENPNVVNEVLMWSATSASIEIVQYLVEHCGADVMSEDGARAIIFASSHGNMEIVRYLVEQCGADVNVKDKCDGNTALMWAAHNDMRAVVQYLVEKSGADVNAKSEGGATAIMRAAAQGNIQTVRYLAERCRANVNTKCNTGDAALMWAAEDGRIEVVSYLVENCGVDINAKNGNGDTALMLAAENDKIQVVQYLAAQCNADIAIANGEGNTAVTKAAAKGYVEVVQHLVEHCGADVNVKNEKGDTALILAVEKEHIQLARYLTEQCDADVNATNEGGNTVLMWAARHGYHELVRYFVEECGAHVNTRNEKGKTVLMWAAQGGEVEVVRYLVEQCNAHVNTKTDDGRTALRIAADYGYHEIQRILTPFLSPAMLPCTSDLAGISNTGNTGDEFHAKWLDADVVVKLFISDASHSPFEDEILLWQRLRHPNVIRMYGACEANPHIRFFVCEYASHGSLLERVRASSVESPKLWKYFHDAALGLEYLHERGVVHGDLRCSNILIGSDGLAKLSNFGLSGSMEKSSQVSSRVVGSRRWQAPEVLRGEIPSYESDMYSLGMSILEAVTGTTPWGGDNDSAMHWSAQFRKEHWTPETDTDQSRGLFWCAPACPPGDARDLVWRMCCQNPHKRASPSSVVRELERLAIKASSEHSQSEHEPADYAYGKIHELWLKLQTYMDKCDIAQNRQAFAELKRIYECLLESTHNATLSCRFHTLLAEFYETVKLSPEQARMMRLSSTRATATSSYAFQWRMESLMASLGLQDPGDSTEREARWKQRQGGHTERFVSGVSDTFLVLQELKSTEERSAFLRSLETEMKNPIGKYTSNQLEVMKHTFDEMTSKLEADGLSQFTPEWFIPWYELVVDEWNCLGEGGFGSVYRAKWLDSDVVVKRVTLAGSDGKANASSTVESSWLTSNDPSAIQAEVIAGKRAEALSIFRREVGIWFGFSHPHVVRLFGACHIGRPFFVCEYAAIGTLVSYLRKHPDELWSKLYEAALGVQYLHARGVVHGDLKGNKFVVGSDMKAKVTDFGLSSVASGEEETLVSGAWNWVAPELLDTNKRPTFASDVYSLDMCIVEALRVVEAVKTGKDSSRCLPWRVADRTAVKYHATRGIPPSRPTICDDDQWRLVRKMCVLDPEKRVKISTVVDELARLANLTTTSQAIEVRDISIPSAANWEFIPEIVANTQGLLASIQCDVDQSDAMILQYATLWENLEHVRGQIDDHESDDIDTCRAAFCSLVADSRASTATLHDRKRSIISLAETTMRCFALQRSLDKFCEAYFLVYLFSVELLADGILPAAWTRGCLSASASASCVGVNGIPKLVVVVANIDADPKRAAYLTQQAQKRQSYALDVDAADPTNTTKLKQIASLLFVFLLAWISCVFTVGPFVADLLLVRLRVVRFTFQLLASNEKNSAVGAMTSDEMKQLYVMVVFTSIVGIAFAAIRTCAPWAKLTQWNPAHAITTVVTSRSRFQKSNKRVRAMSTKASSDGDAKFWLEQPQEPKFLRPRGCRREYADLLGDTSSQTNSSTRGLLGSLLFVGRASHLRKEYDDWNSFLQTHGFDTVWSRDEMMKLAESDLNISPDDWYGEKQRGLYGGVHDDLSFQLLGDLLVNKTKEQGTRIAQGKDKTPLFLTHYTISSHIPFQERPKWYADSEKPDFSQLYEGNEY